VGEGVVRVVVCVGSKTVLTESGSHPKGVGKLLIDIFPIFPIFPKVRVSRNIVRAARIPCRATRSSLLFLSFSPSSLTRPRRLFPTVLCVREMSVGKDQRPCDHHDEASSHHDHLSQVYCQCVHTDILIARLT
jgi:hypothetical protein